MTDSDLQPDGANRRIAPRMIRSEAVALELVKPGGPDLGSGQVLGIRTLDISRSGMRIAVSQPIDIGHIYDLCIDLTDHRKRFLLTGEIRWCRKDADGQWEAGIEVLDGEGTDSEEWEAMFPE